MSDSKHSVSIAMATFNGQKFLPDQLASLQTQTRPPQELVICDDGSSDTTIAILKRFADDAPFDVRIERNHERLGHARNFLRAASLCHGDIVAFCDQDDVWLARKIEVALAAFEAPDGPSVVVHSAQVVDAALRRQEQRFPDIRLDARVPSARCIPGRHWVGFALTFRRALLSLLPMSHFEDIIHAVPEVGHEHWICFLAGLDRGFAFRRESLVLYRQHGANAFGASHDRSVGLSRIFAVDSARLLRHAESVELWASVISDARAEGHLHAGARQAQRWEGVHRELATQLRARASIYRRGALLGERVRSMRRLIATGAYGPSWEGGLGWRAVLRDVAIAIAGVHW
jgi:glycosyltransferase involved in cell wall biosynthesis